MLSDPELDGVIVAAWPSVNADVAIKAIQADKHVLIQKPAALTTADGMALSKAASATRKNVMALPAIDFVPGIRELAPLVKQGKLGTLSFIRVRVSIPGPADYHRDVRRFFTEPTEKPGAIFSWDYARGAGCAADMGPYALALVHYMFGQGKLETSLKSHVDFEGSCLLTLIASEVPCSIELGWSQYPSDEMIVIMGSKATASVSMTGRLSLNPELAAEEIQTALPGRTKAVLPPDPTTAQDRWIDAIQKGQEQAFLPSIASAQWSAEILEQVRGS